MRGIPERWRELLAVALVFAALLPAGVVMLGLTGTAYTGYDKFYTWDSGANPEVDDESVITAVWYVEPFSAEQWWVGAAIVFAAWAIAIALLVFAYRFVRPGGRHGQRAWRTSTGVGVVLWSTGVAGMSVVASAVHRANWHEWWEFAPTDALARSVMTTPDVGREATLMYVPIAIVVAGLVVLAAMGYLRLGNGSARDARVAGGVSARA